MTSTVKKQEKGGIPKSYSSPLNKGGFATFAILN